MYFNKQRKIGILLIPKTGTTSTRDILESLGWNKIPPLYQYPEIYLGKYSNLAEYKLYIFLRNPLDRFTSAIKHSQREGALWQVSEKIKRQTGEIIPEDSVTYEHIVDMFDRSSDSLYLHFEPQSNWMRAANIEVLDFDNYDVEIRRVLELPDTFQVPVLNKSAEDTLGPITDKVRNFVCQFYAADYEFAQRVLGKSW